MKLHIVMHESFEAPAALEDWARRRGCKVTYTRCYSGDRFPESCDFDLLVIMGGPQSPATTTEECGHFNAAEEIAFIQKAIKQKKLLLGICLGAQLIGEALGARFDHSPNREIGVFPLTLTEEGIHDEIFGAFPRSFAVGHWHGDMPGLTSEATVLAVSKGCPRQIVKYAPNIYGFQCHFEFTPAAIDGMIENNAAELANFCDLPYVLTAEQLRAHDFSEMNNLLFEFLDRFMASRATGVELA